MNMNRIARMVLLLALLTGGVWLLGRPGALQPEGAARVRALNSLASAAPAPGAAPAEALGQTVVHEPVTPTISDFSQAAISTDASDGMHARWLRGELDLDENDSVVSEAEFAQMVQAALSQGPTANMQHAVSLDGTASGPQPAAPSPGISFDSLNYNHSGGSVPPDPELAVGPNHMIAVVNVAVAIYNKSGTAVLGPTAAENLFTQPACKSGLYDPNVVYDEEANRWILAYDKGAFSSVGGYCMLVSFSGDPTGSWYEYFFNFNSPSTWLDFPHAGVGDNYIFMGANMFSMGGLFIEGRIYAFNKANLYAGNAVTAIQRGLGTDRSTPQPLRLHGHSTGTWPNYGNLHYFLTDPFNGRNYHLIAWNPATAAMDVVANIDLGNSGQAVSVPQAGSSGRMMANDWRPVDFEYRNGFGWIVQTVSCNPGGGVVNCIRWAQINLSNGSIGPAGMGTYGSDGMYRFFPDLAVNHCNDMVVGYTRSSSSTFPSIWVTGRQSSNPNGVLQAEAQLKAGDTFYTAFDSSPRRWGDYTGMTIDPNGRTFWYLGQYSKNTGNVNGRWGTYIGSFSYPSCTVGPPPDLTDSNYLPLFVRGN